MDNYTKSMCAIILIRLQMKIHNKPKKVSKIIKFSKMLNFYIIHLLMKCLNLSMIHLNGLQKRISIKKNKKNK